MGKRNPQVLLKRQQASTCAKMTQSLTPPPSVHLNSVSPRTTYTTSPSKRLRLNVHFLRGLPRDFNVWPVLCKYPLLYLAYWLLIWQKDVKNDYPRRFFCLFLVQLWKLAFSRWRSSRVWQPFARVRLNGNSIIVFYLVYGWTVLTGSRTVCRWFLYMLIYERSEVLPGLSSCPVYCAG